MGLCVGFYSGSTDPKGKRGHGMTVLKKRVSKWVCEGSIPRLKGETSEIGQPMINGGSFRGRMEMIGRKEKKRSFVGICFMGWEERG